MSNETPNRSHAGFLIVIAISIVFYLLGKNFSPNTSLLLGYGDWFKKVAEGSILHQLAWLISDWGDAAFQKTVLGSLLLILGALLAHLAMGKRSIAIKGVPEGMPLTGTGQVCYGSGLFPHVLAAQIIGAFTSNFLYAQMFNLPDIGFVATFVPIVSVAPSTVLMFGGGPKKVITAGVLAGVICTPFAHLINAVFVTPNNLSVVIGFVGSMTVGGAIVFQACNFIPWMKVEEPADPPDSETEDEAPKSIPKKEISPASFFVRKVLSDFTDANFYGNELAGLLFIIGGLIIFVISPASVAYGSGIFLIILSSQFLTSAIGVYLYWDKILELPFYPTYIPVVTIAPVMVLTYGTGIHVVILGAALGALLGPPIGSIISLNLPKGWHPYLGFTFSMGVNTFIVGAILSFLPGFGLPW